MLCTETQQLFTSTFPPLTMGSLISNMPAARHRSLVAVLPTNEIVIVGGFAVSNIIDKVEIAKS